MNVIMVVMITLDDNVINKHWTTGSHVMLSWSSPSLQRLYRNAADQCGIISHKNVVGFKQHSGFVE